jgi:hypothetical protein
MDNFLNDISESTARLVWYRLMQLTIVPRTAIADNPN